MWRLSVRATGRIESALEHATGHVLECVGTYRIVQTSSVFWKMSRAPWWAGIYSLRSKLVCSVSCGGLHNAAVTSDGKCYTWGCNDEGSHAAAAN